MTSLANALAAAVGSQSEKSNDAPAPFVFQTELSVGGGNLGTSAAAPVLQRPVATRELKDYPWLLVRLGLVSVAGKTMPNGHKCSIGTVILLSHIGSGLSELRESTAVELDIDRCRVSTTINEMVGWGWVVRSESGALSVDFDEIGNFVGMSKSELISGQFLHVPRFMLASDAFHDAACVVFGDLVSQSLLDHPRGAMKNPELAELLGISVSALQKARKHLAEQGFIELKKQGKQVVPEIASGAAVAAVRLEDDRTRALEAILKKSRKRNK